MDSANSATVHALMVAPDPSKFLAQKVAILANWQLCQIMELTNVYTKMILAQMGTTLNTLVHNYTKR